ncbi:MAG: uracil-DNA glycosylase [Sneathiella sp.]|jgi:uracil-DNA glycosylase
MDWHLRDRKQKTVTDTVKNWQEYWPDTVVLPHPSPRNNIWLKRNPWFEVDVIPKLQDRIQKLI